MKKIHFVFLTMKNNNNKKIAKADSMHIVCVVWRSSIYTEEEKKKNEERKKSFFVDLVKRTECEDFDFFLLISTVVQVKVYASFMVDPHRLLNPNVFFSLFFHLHRLKNLYSFIIIIITFIFTVALDTSVGKFHYEVSSLIESQCRVRIVNLIRRMATGFTDIEYIRIDFIQWIQNIFFRLNKTDLCQRMILILHNMSFQNKFFEQINLLKLNFEIKKKSETVIILRPWKLNFILWSTHAQLRAIN